MKIYPEAGEAGVTLVPWSGSANRTGASSGSPSSETCPRTWNAKRAAGSVRRRVRCQGIKYLWTLTYRRARSTRAEVTADLRAFERRLRAAWPQLAFVAVIERGTLNGRLHVHMGVDRRLPIRQLREVWGEGFVWVGDDRHQNARKSARQMARYLAKYITKQAGDGDPGDQAERQPGRHRYYVPRGWVDLCLRRRFLTHERAFHWLTAYYGQPDQGGYWQSEDRPEICGWWLRYPDEAIQRWHAWPMGNSGPAVP